MKAKTKISKIIFYPKILGYNCIIIIYSTVQYSINFLHFFHALLQALDKMEAEWESVLMEISAYKETGTYIMKSGEESAQQLDDHIVMTQAMSFSPYKKPFEQRIVTWENKLRTTQVSIIMDYYMFNRL